MKVFIIRGHVVQNYEPCSENKNKERGKRNAYPGKKQLPSL